MVCQVYVVGTGFREGRNSPEDLRDDLRFCLYICQRNKGGARLLK